MLRYENRKIKGVSALQDELMPKMFLDTVQEWFLGWSMHLGLNF